MKVAVVTPYYNEDLDILVRCVKSVQHQTYICKHILVSDGKPNDWVDTWKEIEHITLPTSHKDAGATPRALGALSAFSRGYDAVAFLDVDNTYEPTHIENMIKTCKEFNCHVVSATRNIRSSYNEQFLYVDNIESNGKEFCDTNCLFLTRAVMLFMSYWITNKDVSLAGDRIFWNIIVNNSNITRLHCNVPTVNYYTKWAWHFKQANVEIPGDSIWMDTIDGKIITHKHKDTNNES